MRVETLLPESGEQNQDDDNVVPDPETDQGPWNKGEDGLDQPGGTQQLM